MNTGLTRSDSNRRGLSNPWRDFFDLENILDRTGMGPLERNTPAVNISENDKNYMVEVVAPGFRKEDFKVDVDGDNNMLTISAETKNETRGGDKNYTRREYSCSSFTRSFNLPENATAENIGANYHDGILDLNIPKREVKQRASKTIPIK